MRAKKNILNDVRGINPGDRDLILEVWTFCKKNNRDPQEEFWDEIPDKRMSALSDEDRELMSSVPDGDGEDGETPAEMKDRLIEEYMAPYYVYGRNLKGRVTYKITDEDKELLEEVINEFDDLVLAETFKRMKESGNRSVEDGLVLALNNRFKVSCDRVHNVKSFRMPDEPGWTTFRPKFSPDDEQIDNIPNWIEVLDRMSDGEAFAAWLWGVYSGDYGGRKILWLYGSGEAGKSTINSLLGEELFGPSVHTISNNALSSSNNNFLNSYFESARLISYPDCNVTTLLMQEAFKSLASGGIDKVLVEHKGKKAYTADINAYAWICSNKKPYVIDETHVTSRLLYVTIDPFAGKPTTPEIAKSRLRDELPGFLAYARACYEVLCPGNYEITVNDDTIRLVDSLIEGASSQFDDIFSTYFVPKEGGKVDAGYLRKIMKKEDLHSKYEVDKFIEYLERAHNCCKSRTRSGNVYCNIEKKSSSNIVQFKAKDKKSEDAF